MKSRKRISLSGLTNGSPHETKTSIGYRRMSSTGGGSTLIRATGLLSACSPDGGTDDVVADDERGLSSRCFSFDSPNKPCVTNLPISQAAACCVVYSKPRNVNINALNAIMLRVFEFGTHHEGFYLN